jgi:host factor-I protein
MKNNSLKDNFLRALVDEQMPVYIFLVNGIKLRGYIIDFDDNTIIMQRNPGEESQLIFKKVVSTVMAA